MATAALAVALLALVVAFAALARAGASSGALEEARREARRAAGAVEEQLAAEHAVTRRLLAQVAAGRAPDAEAILEGQLWRDVDAAEAAALVAAGEVLVVDVRTPGETVSGMIPGATLIPMDELEERKDELPRRGGVLLYCAVGGRSAAACEGLAREGWDDLMNLTGGFSEWRGPVDRPGSRPQ